MRAITTLLILLLGLFVDGHFNNIDAQQPSSTFLHEATKSTAMLRQFLPASPSSRLHLPTQPSDDWYPCRTGAGHLRLAKFQ
jgi:hypothetical protein